MTLHSLDQKLQGLQGKGVAGIDVAQRWHYVQWFGPEGRPIGRPQRVANSRHGFEHLLATRPTQEVLIGMESTGPYWLALAHWLQAQPGVTVVLVNPAHVKRAKELDDNTPTKSDAKDAGVIGRLVWEGRYLNWTPRRGAWATLQTLAVVRRQQRQVKTQWEARIASWLVQYFPEFAEVFKNWRGKGALWVLEHAPLPSDLHAQGLEQIAEGMASATHRRVGMKRAKVLLAEASRSIGLKEAPEAARYQLQSYLMAWRAAREGLEVTEAEQAKSCAETGQVELLQSIPGIGPVVMATLLGEVGDLSRFNDARQVLRLAGLNLTEQSSGKHRGRSHISKRGRPGIRQVMYQAAQVVVATNAQWRAWYDHLRQRTCNPLASKAALVAVAAKLLRVAWACVHHGTPYAPERVFAASMAA